MNSAALTAVETWTPATHPPRPRHLHLVPAPEELSIGMDRRWIERFTQSVVEVLGGHRSATTLVSHLTPVVYQALRSPHPDLRLHDARVLSVRIQPHGQDSIEVAAVVACPQRTRALALRLTQRHERWRCVCVVVL
jgi:hypothetical protein